MGITSRVTTGRAWRRSRYRRFALRESDAIEIAEVLRNNMQGFRGLQSGVAILRCFLDEESDDTSQPIDGSDQWIYQVTLSYVVMHRVPVPTNVTQTNV